MILLSLWLALQAQTQARLSDDQIDQVIAYAQTADGAGGARCYATAAGVNRSEAGGFAVLLEGPAGRIFDAVKTAQKSGRAFTRADVTADMAATTLTVIAYPAPAKQDGSERLPLSATGVAIRTGGAKKFVIKPRRIETMPFRATFAYEDFATIHLGGFEVVVLSDQTERVCTIDATARASIR